MPIFCFTPSTATNSQDVCTQTGIRHSLALFSFLSGTFMATGMIGAVLVVAGGLALSLIGMVVLSPLIAITLPVCVSWISTPIPVAIKACEPPARMPDLQMQMWLEEITTRNGVGSYLSIRNAVSAKLNRSLTTRDKKTITQFLRQRAPSPTDALHQRKRPGDSLLCPDKGFDELLTALQRQMLVEFKRKVQAELPLALALCKHRREPTNPFLQRFLKARNFQIDAAFKMLEGELAFRQEKCTSELIRKHPREILQCEPIEAVRHMPIWLRGHDKCGRPVFYQHFKDIQADKLLATTSLERYAEYHWWSQEVAAHMCVRQSDATSRHVDKLTMVIDLENMALSQVTSKFYLMIKDITKLDQEHFPERAGKIFIINAPRLFSFVWSGIRPFINKATQAKMRIHAKGNSNQLKMQQELLAHIDEEQLPSDYGGRAPALSLDDNLLLHSLDEIEARWSDSSGGSESDSGCDSTSRGAINRSTINNRNSDDTNVQQAISIGKATGLSQSKSPLSRRPVGGRACGQRTRVA